MRPVAKEAIKDPDMCNCVKNLVKYPIYNIQVDDVVDDIWPDVIEELKYNLMMGLDEPFVPIT
jgi:hypothetical protein